MWSAASDHCLRHSAEAFEAAEQSFDLVAPLIYLTVVLPGRDACPQGWNDRNEAKIKRELTRPVAFVCLSEKLDVMFVGFISFALIADGLRLWRSLALMADPVPGHRNAEGVLA